MVAHQCGRELVQAIAQVLHAAPGPGDVGTDALEARLVALGEIEDLAAVVEGELVGVLPGAVDYDPLGLGEGLHQGLHVPRRATAGEDRDRPAAAGGIVEHRQQAPLLLQVARSVVRRRLAVIGVDLRIGSIAAHGGAVGLAKLHAPDHETGHAALLPGVEALHVALHPVLKRAVVAQEDPSLHPSYLSGSSMAQRKPTIALWPFQASR